MPQPRTTRPRGPLPALARTLGSRPWLMRLAPLIIRIETILRAATGNRWSLVGIARLPSAQVTVPGRKSGKMRTATMLVVPLDPDTAPLAGTTTARTTDPCYIVAGSNWGREKNPAWAWNLGAVDRARVRIGPRTAVMGVRRLEGEEREQAWTDITYYWPGYGMEQELAPHRRFPLFLLSTGPAAGASSETAAGASSEAAVTVPEKTNAERHPA